VGGALLHQISLLYTSECTSAGLCNIRRHSNQLCKEMASVAVVIGTRDFSQLANVLISAGKYFNILNIS